MIDRHITVDGKITLCGIPISKVESAIHITGANVHCAYPHRWCIKCYRIKREMNGGTAPKKAKGAA